MQMNAHATETHGPADQTIACADCGADFTWTAGEQQFYREKGLCHPPKHCPNCRAKKRQQHERER